MSASARFCLLLIGFVAGCAQGTSDPQMSGGNTGGKGTGLPHAGAGASIGGKGGASGQVASGKAGTTSVSTSGMAAPPPTPVTGGPCTAGDSPACMCSATQTGHRFCNSGVFSECRSCVNIPTAGTGGSGTASGGSISSGSGGTSGSGGKASASGGSSGSGGKTGTTGGAKCTGMCTNSCFPVGVLACCNALGTCGCTWAPGAYCL